MGRMAADRPCYAAPRPGGSRCEEPICEDCCVFGCCVADPEIVSCCGVGVNLIKNLDSCSSSKVGVHDPFDVISLDKEQLLRRPS